MGQSSSRGIPSRTAAWYSRFEPITKARSRAERTPIWPDTPPNGPQDEALARLTSWSSPGPAPLPVLKEPAGAEAQASCIPLESPPCTIDFDSLEARAEQAASALSMQADRDFVDQAIQHLLAGSIDTDSASVAPYSAGQHSFASYKAGDSDYVVRLVDQVGRICRVLQTRGWTLDEEVRQKIVQRCAQSASTYLYDTPFQFFEVRQELGLLGDGGKLTWLENFELHGLDGVRMLCVGVIELRPLLLHDLRKRVGALAQGFADTAQPAMVRKLRRSLPVLEEYIVSRKTSDFNLGPLNPSFSK